MNRIITFLFFSLLLGEAHSQHWAQWGQGVFEPLGPFYVDTLNNELYTGGRVLNSANDTISGIAKWNGSDWIAMANPLLNYSVSAIIKYNDTVYVGGSFRKSNGAPGNSIIKWNGTTWDSLSSSPYNSIIDLCVFNNQLWVCGDLVSIGGISNPGHIVAYDGTWHTIPQIIWLVVRVRKMLEFGNELYIGGTWDADSGMKSIIKWNGTWWSALGNGLQIVTGTQFDLVLEMKKYHNELYVGGDFSDTTQNPGNYIARWNGSQWNQVSKGTNDYVYRLQVYNDELYALGNFSVAGEIPCNGIAKWDGSRWCCISSSFNGSVQSMFVYNNNLIISGDFTNIDGYPIKYLAKWIGGNYTDTCENVNGIEELTRNKINIYPNPVNDKLQIQSGKIKINKIEITDILGKEIYSRSNSDIQNQIDISSLSSGLYFLLLETKQGQVVKKFVKE